MKTKEQMTRDERSHQEALALVALERSAREEKTAKLREMRLAKERDADTPKKKALAKSNARAKPTIDMMKAAKAKIRKA